MKILMLTPYLPYPLLSGGQTRSYNLIKNLSKKHAITLFSFIRSEEEKKYVPLLKKFCSSVFVVKRRPAWSLFNILLTIFTPYPFLVCLYISRTLRSILQTELQNAHFDLIHAETFYVMPNIPKTPIPILLVEQTIEYRVYKHFVETISKIFIKPLLWLDVLKVKFWEKHYWGKASKVVAMSEADARVMRKLIPKLNVDIVPNGVDIESFRSVQRQTLEEPIILYVGNFKWLQNREALEILINKIWPQIKKKVHQARLLIVGRGQIDSLKAVEDDRITFDEQVSDIRKSYAKATIMLAPIEGPGGTRLKILEAMASGCPVVTTPVGIEGIAAREGYEVLVGNTEKELVVAAIRLLGDKTLQHNLSHAAYQLVAKKYSWVDIGKKLDAIYRGVSHE